MSFRADGQRSYSRAPGMIGLAYRAHGSPMANSGSIRSHRGKPRAQRVPAASGVVQLLQTANILEAALLTYREVAYGVDLRKMEF